MSGSLDALGTSLSTATGTYLTDAETAIANSGTDIGAVGEFGMVETTKYTVLSSTLNDVANSAEEAAKTANR